MTAGAPTSRRRSTRRGIGLVGLVLTAGVLASCSDAVRVAPLPGADTPQCEAASAAWPADLQGLERRATATQSVTVAAWGDPAVIARCGGTPPGPSENPCIEVDGVDWLALPLEDGMQFVTFGRSPAIEVLIPQAYGSSAALGGFTEAVDALDDTGSSCS